MAKRPAAAFGLIVSLALVFVVVASAFAVYGFPSRGPDGNQPTQINGAAAATATVTATTEATSTPDNEGAAPVYSTAPDGTDYVRVPFTPCTNDRFDYDAALEIAIGNDYPFDQIPPPVQIARSGPSDVGLVRWTVGTLPAGDPVGDDTIAELATLYGQYVGCEIAPLRQVSLFTPEGFARLVYLAPSRFLTDVIPDGTALQLLWLDEQGRLDTGLLNDAPALSRDFLYDFRMLEDGKIVAFLSMGGQVSPDSLPAFYDGAGYVVFSEVDGQWLVDEQYVPI